MSDKTRKILILLGGGIAVLALIAVAGVAYLYRQATALPDWYDPDAPMAVLDAPEAEEGVAAPPLRWESVPDEAGPTTPASPDEARQPAPKLHKRAVMRNFHIQTVAKDPILKKATRTSRAEYRDGKLEAGAVLDMERIDRGELKGDNRKFYDRATKAFPALRKKQVYIALEDEPVSRDGFLQLGPAPKIKIGNLTYSLDAAAKRVGMSPKNLRRQIDRELRRLKVRDPNLPVPETEDPPMDGPI